MNLKTDSHLKDKTRYGRNATRLNEVGVTVLIGPDKAMIVLDISQKVPDAISLINYSMDEHALVLKSPTQTRLIHVMSQLQIADSEVFHLQDRIRLVIHCKKPI